MDGSVESPNLMSAPMTRTLTEGVCVDADDIAAFLRHRLDPASVHALERHVASCDDCRALLSELAQLHTVTASGVGPTFPDVHSGTLPQREDSGPALAPGAIVGRYVVQARLGEGGMGVVYAARDPELNRKVALKVLRGDARDPQRLGERLRREAQAMAQLAHPNVVMVHDVGSLGNRLFIAMELVEGTTLRGWLAASPRSWREIVAKLVPAGEGLAAAHAAGLVHRDFKPDNVLVGMDGRVRVGDFGLARAFSSTPSISETSALVQLTSARTITGSIVGTPYYMAPEQFLGQIVDERTDQFAFCVTLHSAIVGQHPFQGDSLESLSHAVTHGLYRPPSRPDPMPRWLRRVLRRGLSTRPEHRYPSMRHLLRALTRDRRRRLRYAAAAVLPVLALAAVVTIASRPGSPCAGGEAKWAGVWDGARAGAVARAFVATGQPYAGAALAQVRRELDRYRRAWTLTHNEACEAARVRGEQTHEMLAKRGLCLDQRLERVRALTDGFLAADAGTVAGAAYALDALPELAPCSDVQALALQPAPPEDARVARVLRDLARVHDLASARHLVDEARQLGYRPLEAEALLEQARVERAAGDAVAARRDLERAIWAAEAAHVDEAAARGWLALMPLDAQAGLALAPRVTALLERMGGNPTLEAELHLTRATLLLELDRLPEARAEAERARAPLSDRPLRLARVWRTLADIGVKAGMSDLVEDYRKQELVLLRGSLGNDHPAVTALEARTAPSHR
jgi:eukaryotic-like serine/threonine-protein kinase